MTSDRQTHTRTHTPEKDTFMFVFFYFESPEEDSTPPEDFLSHRLRVERESERKEKNSIILHLKFL